VKKFYPDDGGSTFLQNIGTNLPDNRVSRIFGAMKTSNLNS
jgi:hypothetical protein